jgi:hypothetical protein
MGIIERTSLQAGKAPVLYYDMPLCKPRHARLYKGRSFSDRARRRTRGAFLRSRAMRPMRATCAQYILPFYYYTIFFAPVNISADFHAKITKSTKKDAKKEGEAAPWRSFLRASR